MFVCLRHVNRVGSLHNDTQTNQGISNLIEIRTLILTSSDHDKEGIFWLRLAHLLERLAR